MHNLFEVVSDLKIGHIVEVTGTTIRIELSGDVTELSRTYNGRVYPIGQIGSIVKIHFGRQLIFGFVTSLRMRSEEIIDSTVTIPPEADQRLMEIELFAEGIWNAPTKELSFKRGISTYPLPRQNVHLLTRNEVDAIYAAAEGKRDTECNHLVQFAHYIGSNNAICRANVDKMFGMHCAILGSTGSGKSGAVAALIHSILDHEPTPSKKAHPRIVIIDPHGEYGKAFQSRAVIYRAYDPIGHSNDSNVPIKLPYWLMSGEEFRMLVIGKTEHEATSQNNIIYKALTHARLQAAGLVPAAPSSYGQVEGIEFTDEESIQIKYPKENKDIAEFDRDKPRPFSLTELKNHITYVQAARKDKNGSKKVTDTEFAAKFKSILDKLSVLSNDPRIRFLMDEPSFKDEATTLEQVIAQFVGTPDAKEDSESDRDIRILDISGLPNEVAGPLSAMVARLLFQYKLYQTSEERERDPIVVVCEEAHRYVPDRGEAEYSAAQTAIRRIAREGRKYGISLMLVSQRPSDVESTVISQCGTWIILRLTNAADQQQVSRFLPDGLSGMTRMLPNLMQQEAIFVGEGAAMPARIRIFDLTRDKLPRSDSAKYAKSWTMDRLTIEEIQTVAERMAPPVKLQTTPSADDDLLF